MTQQATVTAVLADGTARIAVRRRSACADDCRQCAGCAHPGETIEVTARNGAGAQTGDWVVVESATARVLGLAGLLYLLPVALMIAGYFVLFWSETAGICGALVGLGLGLILCRAVAKRMAQPLAFHIVAIDRRPRLH